MEGEKKAEPHRYTLVALLPFVFLLTTIPLVIFLSFFRQPISVPDEWSHIARAAQIADGIVLTEVAEPGQPPQGAMDPNFRALMRMVHERRHEPLASAMPDYRVFHWGPDRILANYNSSVYFPAPFLVTAAVLKFGEWSRLSIVDTLQYASMANGLLCIALAALAIALAPRGKFLVFAVAALPMTLFSFASASPDGPIVASALLLFAFASKAISERGTSVKQLVAAALIATVIAATKLPYLPLVISGLLAIWLSAKECRPTVSLLLGLLGLTVAVPLLWAFISNAGSIDVSWGAGIADPGRQVSFLLHHPLAIFQIAGATLQTYGWHYPQQMVGMLGWLDAPISRFSRNMFLAILLLLVVIDSAAYCFGRAQFLVLFGMVVSVGAVFLSLYVAYNPVGSLVAIEGIQGRYFLPVLPFLGLLCPLAIGEHSRQRVAFVVVIAAVLLSGAELTRTVIERYYL